MERFIPKELEEGKIIKIVEETLKMLKELEQNNRIEILNEEKVREKLIEMFEREVKRKVEKKYSIWEVSVSVNEFLQYVLEENSLKIKGEIEEEREYNRNLLIERLKNNIYKFRAYEEL